MALNRNLQHLVNIAQKPERLGIGLMSGTSLDGLDIALCSFTGSGLQTGFKLKHFATIPYPEAFKHEVQQVFAKKDSVSLEKVCLLNAYIGTYHAELILQALQDWGFNPQDVDFIASHGQTIYHAPAHQHQQTGYPNATLQIGDGDHLAVKTGILTISDFRQKHIASGGEGAPLALYGDVLLGCKQGEDRILLNIGGIANLTFLTESGDLSTVLCTDIGPGNTLIDAACRKYFNCPFDEDARIAYSGKVNDNLLLQLLTEPFLQAPSPKTTGPEVFNLSMVDEAIKQLEMEPLIAEDLIATLSAYTGQTIADFISTNYGNADINIFASGGGARNPFIIQWIAKALPNATIGSTDDLGINPDAKEAILFALLGNEALCGEPLTIGQNPSVLMGKFSFPE